MSMGKFRSLVRAAVSSPHVSRVRIFGHSLTGQTTIQSPILLVCDDDPDYDLSSDGTNIAEVQPFSKITNIKLACQLDTGGNSHTDRLEWILVKDPDGMLAAASAVPADLFTADVSTTTVLLRKYTLAYGWFVSTASAENQKFNIRIKAKALRRAGLLHDGDRLRFFVRNESASAGFMNLTGTITTRGR